MLHVVGVEAGGVGLHDDVEQDGGAAPGDLATEWIANNRDTVDGWLSTATAGPDASSVDVVTE